jgi:hypothetical protein
MVIPALMAIVTLIAAQKMGERELAGCSSRSTPPKWVGRTRITKTSFWRPEYLLIRSCSGGVMSMGVRGFAFAEDGAGADHCHQVRR